MTVRILTGDVREKLRELPDASVHCCVTSPPYYGLRDYGVSGQIGLESSPQEYVETMVAVFREVRRVLRDDGTVWLNLGDSYARMQEGNVAQSKNPLCQPPTMTGRIKNAGLKPKDLIGIPWRVAFALQADGWWLRSDIIWHKPNPMPESVTDRPTSAHEHIFLLAKSERYHFDAEAVKEAGASIREFHAETRGDGVDALVLGRASRQAKGPSGFGADGSRNIRNVWTVATQPFSEAHFATFPPILIEPCIKAGCPLGGTVLDPFGGAGTTGLVADRLGRNAILTELNPEYAVMAQRRIADDAGMFAGIEAGG